MTSLTSRYPRTLHAPLQRSCAAPFLLSSPRHRCQRPSHRELWHLSPYEFCMYWKPKLVSYPKTLRSDRDPRHEAKLTDQGRELLQEQEEHGEEVELQPGVHYVVKEEGGPQWLPFPDVPATQHFRHDWILLRHKRPLTPSFLQTPDLRP